MALRRAAASLTAFRLASAPRAARFVPARPAPVQTQTRSYAQIAHNIYAVVPQYDLPPRPMEAWTRSKTQLGSAASRKMRKQQGLKARIPGVLMIPGQEPVLLTVNPSSIQKWLLKEHFLGRRYLLSIDGKEPIEVYPTTLGMHPITYYPQSVAFATWKGTMPRQRLAPEMRFKIRKFDEMYLKEENLFRSIEEINKRLREDARKPSPVRFEVPESFVKPYETTAPRTRSISLSEEVRDMIVASRSGEILKLEPEEYDRDEVMQIEEEEDE